MKYNFLFALMFILSACSGLETTKDVQSTFKLKKISSKSAKSNKTLGSLKAELRTKSGSVIERDTSSLGNCSDCVRGYEVNDYLGIQLVGTNSKNLKALRKQARGVTIVDCPQGVTFDQEYSCTFKVKGQTYSLKLKMKS